MTSKSESFFKRTLDQKTDEARRAVTECIKQYLAPNNNKRQSAAQAAYDAVQRICEMLHESDRPSWLPELLQDLNFARNNISDEKGMIAVERIASQWNPQLRQQQWRVGTPESEIGFDFDAIYEKHRSECRIPELFDQIIKYLKEIVTSDAIDSVTAIRELNNIISTLHSAREGSYFATRGAWYFVVSWFKNTGWELLGTIPIAGSAVKGLRKTLEETNESMLKLHDNIQSDLEAKISADFPRLEYQPPQLPALEYKNDGDQNSLPESAT